MPPTALRVSRTCRTRPSRTTHGKCSGSRPPSSPGQRCWSWSGCWVSHRLIRTVQTYCGSFLNSAHFLPIKIQIDVSTCQSRFCIVIRNNLGLACTGFKAKWFLVDFFNYIFNRYGFSLSRSRKRSTANVLARFKMFWMTIQSIFKVFLMI